MSTISVRYIVSSVDDAIPFYEQLGFVVDIHPAPGFARLTRNGLSLLLNQPAAGGAGQASNAGAIPEPGGWNRFQIETNELDDLVGVLRQTGARFRTDILQGNGGRQAVVEDPSGNPVELFEPA